MTVRKWNRAGETCVDIRSDFDGNAVDLQLELRMVGRRLHSVRVTGSYQGPRPWRGLKRATWEAEARVEDWWSALGRRTPPITLRITHPLASASILLTRGKDRHKRWTGKSTIRVTGRGLVRPIAAVGLLMARRTLQKELDEGFQGFISEWNRAVPRLSGYESRDRLTFHHRTKVKAVSREWAEAYVAALQQAVEELRFERGRLSGPKADIRLLAGKHLKPGARYRIAPLPADEIEPLEATVLTWGSPGPTRIEFSSPENVQSGWVELDSVRKPRSVRAALDGEFNGIPQLTCTADLDLDRWWAAAGEPALTASARNPIGEGGLSVTVAPADDGGWTVEASAWVEGRSWGRPLLRVAALLAASSEAFEEAVDAYGRWCDLAAAQASGRSPADAAAAALRVLR